MFNMKVAATIFITLAILVAILSASPQLGGFFQSTKDKITDFLSPAENIERNISFSLTIVSGIKNITITSDAKDVNLNLRTSNFTAQVKDANIVSKGRIQILGFSGSLSVNNRSIELDGSSKKVELEDTTVTFPQGAIKSKSLYDSLVIENLSIKEFIVPEGGGLTVDRKSGIVTDKEIKISHLLGKFEFTQRLEVSGKAAKISIPEAKISIG